jgi:transporter family protein
MERWVAYAFISMLFAGMTAVVAKQGLTGISAELGLTIRTIFVFLFIFVFAAIAVAPAEIRNLQKTNYLWLGISSASTALSWIFYYKALKMGNVATVALIDKGSVIVAIILAWLFLKETISLRQILGAALIFVGILVISKK